MARILIIEDNPANLDLMAYLLHAGGHEIVTAQDGEEGLAQAATLPLVDLIVCDVHLPRLDGYEVAHRLKADTTLRQIPLLAVTALSMVGDKEKVLAAGFDSYIPKPINPREFAAQVRAFLPAAAAGAAARPVAAAPAMPAPERAGASAGAGVRILVVDDSPANLLLARATLEPYGYQVTAVASVAEASACMEQEDFDLILSDLNMPDATGLQLLSTIRDDPRWRQIPFVLTSSSVWGTRDRERSRALHANRFLIRPISPQKILDAVAECLAELKEADRGKHPGR